MIHILGLALLSIVLSLEPSFVHAQSIDQNSVTRGTAPRAITRRMIPFTIIESGKYQLADNITFTKPGAAITIAADNVQLNLAAHSIELTDAKAIGIDVKSITEFVIENDNIKNTSSSPQTGFGIRVKGARKGLIQNVFTVNHLAGLRIEDSVDIRVEGSEFFHATEAGASVVASKNIAFTACAFDASGNGLKFSGANQDCSMMNCKVPSSKFQNLLVQQMNGMIVEGCLFTETGSGDPTKASLVQFGDAKPAQVCNDVIFKNCNIVNKSSNTAPEGLGIYQGSGFLVEDCVIDITNVGTDPAADLSCIHISNPGLGTGTIAKNVIIRNCVITGSPTDGIYPDTGPGGGAGSSNVLMEGCLVTGALKDGIFIAGTSDSTVRNCTVVNNGTNGIFIGETSPSNSVIDNVVSNNGASIIVSSLLPQGTGIGIASDSSKNMIQHNQVFNNATYGINDLGSSNHSYFNTAHGNITANYSAGITNVSAPGAAAKAGENISA